MHLEETFQPLLNIAVCVHIWFLDLLFEMKLLCLEQPQNSLLSESIKQHKARTAFLTDETQNKRYFLIRSDIKGMDQI